MASKWTIKNVVRLLRKPSRRSTRDESTEPPERVPKEGKTRRPPERRESSRFQSAARILRSLGGRNREPEDGGRVRGETSSLNRSNPHYHSEGKGANKPNLEKESVGPSHKERSKSFCDKPEAKKKYSQDIKKLRKESSSTSKLERRNKSASVLPSSATSFKDDSTTETSSGDCNSIPFIVASSNFEPKLLDEVDKLPLSSSNDHLGNQQQHGGEVVRKFKDADKVEVMVSSYSPPPSRKEPRPNRKLTKDSGYETSPYSEGDYANLTPSSSELSSESSGRLEEEPTAGVTTTVHLSTTTEEKFEEQPALKSDRCQEGPQLEEPISNSVERIFSGLEDTATISSPPTKSSGIQRFSSAESLATFADSLLAGVPPTSPSSPLPPAKSTPTLCQYDVSSSAQSLSIESRDVNHPLHGSRSTPNLEDTEDEIMVTKKHSMYSYLEGSSNSRKGGPISNFSTQDPYWDYQLNPEDNFSNPANYAHHLRSSSYQLIHSRQLSSGSYHNRQSSNASNYSDGEDVCLQKSETLSPSKHSFDRSRCFSFDSLGGENEISGDYPTLWNISEPDLSTNHSLNLTSTSYFQPQKYEKGQIIPPAQPVSLPSKKMYGSDKSPSSPPPPPVRDASSLKYIRYGPGHEKFPSWPVPASTASFVGPQNHHSSNSSNISYLSDDSQSYVSSPQGSHRSHSWTEQSEYPKEKCGGYARPFLKKQFSPSFQKQLRTVMEKCEKIPPEMFLSCPPEDLLRSPNYSLIDSYLKQSTYYPLYDRDGRGIDDKDYSIPSPPEHDPGMGEAHLSQVTMEELEEHARRCDLAYGDIPSGNFIQITPLLDQLRQESYSWDGSSERDSGRGESESFTDSRYSNGRESVTTVVTNSSSASSSETLKWHGSLSDISIMSGHSRDTRQDQNVVHSARVQAPQRHNSESVLYYGRGKPLKGTDKGRDSGKTFDISYSRNYKDSLWSREVERNNEMNNLKKFPSYSYTQPLSQINEAPLAESGDLLSSSTRSPKSPTVDLRKPPSVAERINELERQSRPSKDVPNVRWQRDRSEPRDVRHYREETRGTFSHGPESCRKISSERDLRIEAVQTKCELSYLDSKSLNSVSRCKKNGLSNGSCQMEDTSYVSNSIPPQSSFSESEKSTDAAYSYLDPDKKCKISGATLKNIQKQALLSFYERRTGKSLNGSPGSSFLSQSNVGEDGSPSKWGRQSLRGGGKSGQGMARLGRVPDLDLEEGPSPCAPIRSRSISGGREKMNDPDRIGISSLSPLNSAPKELPPELPAKPLNPVNLASVNSPVSQDEETDLDREGSRASQENFRRLSPSRLCNGILSTPRKESLSATKPPPPLPSGPSLPPLPNETPPKPPERPPKKPNLRSLFHVSQNSTAEPSRETNDSQEPECKESLTPRTYFYRKPPAPDPPQTISESSSVSAGVRSPNSRSPTPELPPPPPPPVTEEMEVIVFDEPLPPPPSTEETVPLQSSPPKSPSKKILSSPISNGNYHKDSYMAHRRDWKTGYEGRYRRTQSPTATDRNIVNGRGRECYINNNNNNNNNLKISHSMTQSSSPITNKPPVLYKIKGNMRSAVSTSSLLKRPTSPSNKDVVLNNSVNDNERSLRNINNNLNNDWASHPYQTSTTVDFTSDELKAFKARQAALESKSSPATSSYSIEFNSCDSIQYTSPLRPLTRAVSVGEPLLHHTETSLGEIPEKLHTDDEMFICSPLCTTETTTFHSSSSTLTSSSSSSISRYNSSSETINAASEQSSTSSNSKCINSTHYSLPNSPVSHDGTVTAHPATVTEEQSSCPVSPTPSIACSETFSSHDSIPEDNVHRNDFHSTSQPPVPPQSLSLAINLNESSSSLVSTNSTTVLNRSLSTSNLESPATTTTKTSVLFKRSLSSTGTHPAMTIPDLSPEEEASRENIVVLRYGRTPNPEEVDCDQKSLAFVERNDIDRKLQNLLAPGLGYKSTACYMEGVFALELRRDLLCHSHAKHPDLRNDMQLNERTSTDDITSQTNGEKAPLSADSLYLITSESKAKMLSKLRSSPTPNSSDQTNSESQILAKRKEELLQSISRKVEILQVEQSAIKEEMALNSDLGIQVTSRIESRAKASEAEKYKLHVEEIDKITSLLLGLSGRLARAENALVSCNDVDPEEKRILEGKRDKLKEQLEEAKRLKENIDRRAIQVSRIVTQYLSEEEYADYDHFTKMKAKLLMDAKEINDKVKLGEEQLDALKKISS